MPVNPTSRLEDVLLTANDIEEIFALYELCRTTTTYGFLAIRTENDYRTLFRNPDDVIATGVRDNGRLIAHSICHRLSRNPYENHHLLGAVDPSAEKMYHGDGTTVHPDFQGRMLAMRMFKLRQHAIAVHQIDHMIALVAVDNLVSIGNVLHSGALLVGFARDETAMNYIAYGGRFNERLKAESAPIQIDWKDHESQSSLFERQYVVHELKRKQQTGLSAGCRHRQFSFRPMK